MSDEQCSANVGDRAHEDGRVIACCDEPPTLPISLSLDIDRADDDGATTNNLRARYAAPEGIGDKHRTNPATLMAAVDSQSSDQQARDRIGWAAGADATRDSRSEEHTSELQSLIRIPYTVFCLKKHNVSQITLQKRKDQDNT